MLRAEKEWGSLWKHDQPYQICARGDVPLTDLTVDELNDVLRKIPKNKAGGADHWKPQELLVLPRVLKEALLKWIHRAESEGVWPEGFNVAHIALIGKPGATHEGQLRPIYPTFIELG